MIQNNDVRLLATQNIAIKRWGNESLAKRFGMNIVNEKKSIHYALLAFSQSKHFNILRDIISYYRFIQCHSWPAGIFYSVTTWLRFIKRFLTLQAARV